MYTGNGKLFTYRKMLYTFFAEYSHVLNWEEACAPADYASFNPRDVYAISLRIGDEVGYCYIVITGRVAGVERPYTSNVRLFADLDGMNFRTEYLTNSEPMGILNQLITFIFVNNTRVVDIDAALRI